MIAATTAVLCLALNIYYEARGETYKGKEAVAHVVLNRANSNMYPDGVCEVVYQKGQFQWVTMKGLKKPHGASWQEAQHIAQTVLDGESTDPTKGAMYFHNAKLPYSWNHKYVTTAKIGNHVFYKRKQRF